MSLKQIASLPFHPMANPARLGSPAPSVLLPLKHQHDVSDLLLSVVSALEAAGVEASTGEASDEPSRVDRARAPQKIESA